MSSLVWVAEQIRKVADAAGKLPGPELRFNPKPPGVFREGSATEAVLFMLASHPHVWLPRQAIVERTGRTGKAVDWALIFLRDQGLVETIRDGARNPRYIRYRATAAAVDLVATMTRGAPA